MIDIKITNKFYVINQINIVNYWLVFILFIMMAMTSVHAEAGSVGKVEFTKGSVVAERQSESPRMLGTGEELFQGDKIQTSDRSFVILAFNDGSKITVRPNSSFSIDTYVEGEDAKAVFGLQKGGVRASSGEIAKKDSSQFQIKTKQAIVQAAKADYSVRLCSNDCQGESEQMKPAAMVTNQTVIGRVVEIKGSAFAQGKIPVDTPPRTLKVGSAIYRTDTVSSDADSIVILVFRDGGRFTIEASSSLRVAEYTFEAQDKKDSADFTLVKGGLRALTGLIGKADKDSYKVTTPVATIGIRGTGFDLKCKGDCINDEASTQNDKVLKGEAEGLYSYVWQGGIYQQNESGSFDLNTGKANYLASANSKPIDFPEIPKFFTDTPSPRPDKKEVNMDSLFAAEKQEENPAGLYVTVEDGDVELITLDEDGGPVNSEPMYLGKNEAAYVNKDGTETIRLAEVQNFLLLDSTPSPSTFDAETAEVTYSILLDESASGSLTGDVYMCRCD